MPDISKFITDEEIFDKDPAGRLAALGEWSEDLARRLASDEGLELGAAHLAVLRWLRERYRDHGPEPARTVRLALEERFVADGGRKYLYRLFPKGPVNQGSRLAGLPAPAGAADQSFGTAY